MTIVSAADDRYFDGLLVTLASLLVNSKSGITYGLHVLDGGIEDANWQKLDETLGKIDRQFELRRHVIGEEAFSDFPSLHFPSKMYYARLILHKFVSDDRIIYVDSDILFLRDVSELAVKLDKDHGIHAAIDQTVKTIGADVANSESFGVNPISRHLNSGVMVIDRMGDPPGDKVLKDAFAFLEEHPNVCATVDQTAINMVLDNRFHELDRTWNFMSNHVCLAKDMPHMVCRDVNLHYVTKFKPWLVYSNEFAFLIYYEFCKSIGYELRAIRLSRKKHFFRLAISKFRPSFYSAASILFRLIGLRRLSESFAKRKRIAEEFINLQKKQAPYRRELLASLKGWGEEIQRELR